VMATLGEDATFYLDAGFPSSQDYWEKRLGPPVMSLDHYWGPGAPHKIWKIMKRPG